ncbi:hypothetical protein H2200_001350 [Cladophialophora chaetospira]|uniref:Prion-inhibition and propagation HeLo domain-containing protein n=1 Tax=Cladophialophora chaetospira TaxID=386627 RepID=A0AA38XLH4_9EURO|nr:hypothetical protein H2200_001350 [Cladophialophora chaetospira]
MVAESASYSASASQIHPRCNIAEAAGLALGAVALIELFGTCIDLFDCIAIGRSFDHDSKILSVKLDVERALLLYWSEKIGLFKRDAEERFSQLKETPLIGKLLQEIHTLLSDGDRLRQQYGLEPIQDSDSRLKIVFSKLRIKALNEEVNHRKSLKSRSKDTPKDITPLKRTLWAIHDKNKFENLVQDLSYFVKSLVRLLPSVAVSGNKQMIQNDLEGVRDEEYLNLLTKATQSTQLYFTRLTRDRLDFLQTTTEKRILEALWFRTMDDRKEKVEDAHPETFHWALNPGHKMPWDSLPDFLESASGIYWIRGKPGCGKSTLMKYLFGEEKTSALLRAWAGGTSFTLASFFFWYYQEESHLVLAPKLVGLGIAFSHTAQAWLSR